MNSVQLLGFILNVGEWMERRLGMESSKSNLRSLIMKALSIIVSGADRESEIQVLLADIKAQQSIEKIEVVLANPQESFVPDSILSRVTYDDILLVETGTSLPPTFLSQLTEDIKSKPYLKCVVAQVGVHPNSKSVVWFRR